MNNRISKGRLFTDNMALKLLCKFNGNLPNFLKMENLFFIVIKFRLPRLPIDIQRGIPIALRIRGPRAYLLAEAELFDSFQAGFSHTITGTGISPVQGTTVT